MAGKITRRQFIAGTLATGAALLSSPIGADAGRSLKSMTDTVQLGNTGVKVSYLGLGTGTIGWNNASNQTRLGTVKFARLIRHALDQGINYFDLADTYGSHKYLRASLKGIPRENYVIETKMWFHKSRDAKAELDRFLAELNTDYIDIMHIHCVTNPNWHNDMKSLQDVLEEAKQKKIIRTHGISIHDLQTLQQAANNPWVENVLARINPFGEKMDGKPKDVVVALQKLHDAGKGVTGMKILGEGAIVDKREESLRYVLGLNCVDAIVIGFESTDQIDEIIRMGNKALRSNLRS
ncbi:MAG: aldo/keto reductase [Armatimonadetes bacterium]|jgi:predicted aldo/keto reductase-like oxidoreductase|nr:aldo/keto reductase [Armatimonadota bacterium]